MEASKGTIVGIDLGTTYSCIAAIDELGNPVIGKNKNGNPTTPSVIHFPVGRAPADCEVGQVAKDSAVTDPERTAQLFKPLMGKKGAVAVHVDGIDVSPQEASAHVLKKLADDYRERYGRDIAGAVITVPAHFGLQEREATREAGEIAGLNVLGVVQEPVAAAVYYGACESSEDGSFLVYDLGGGTFDVSAITVRHEGGRDVISVICAEGNHELGGRLWDDRVISHLRDEYFDQKGRCELSPFSEQLLRSAAEEAKCRLSETEETPVNLMLDAGPARIMLSRGLFDELTSDLLANTIDLTAQALDRARDAGCGVSSILLVGGSTWMPQVKAALEANFPHLALKRTDPDEAVAKGAAICASRRMIERADSSDGSADMPAPGSVPMGHDIEFEFVTSKSYGVKAMFGDGVERISNLIQKNVRIDAAVGSVTAEKTYFTLQGYPQQTSVIIDVYESDVESTSAALSDGRLVVSQEFKLAEFRLPERSPIDVAFALDEEGLLKVRAREPKSGRTIGFEKRVSSGLSQKEKEAATGRVTGVAVG